jgi:hypothetical protein
MKFPEALFGARRGCLLQEAMIATKTGFSRDATSL